MSALQPEPLRDVLAIATSWSDEARRRRQITTADPVADTLEHCAGELRLRVREIERSVEELTPEQYARLEGVTPPTVRAWIRKGWLPARETASGYRIPKDARRKAS